MDYDYTEKEDSRDDTVQDDRKFIAHGVIGEPSAYICQAIRNDKKYPISIA